MVLGTNGANGVDGENGIAGTASCVACHNESHRAEIDASYLLSGHKAGGAVSYAGGRNGCAQCHSNEGYIDYITTGSTASGYTGQTAIGCTTCHESHSTFDFETDGNDFALRSFDPVTLIVDASYTVDFGDTSNNCASCHQPRTATPTSGDGEFMVSSAHWGPHHGPQTTLLEGIQGANIVGSTAYPIPGTATHRTGSSCVSCHMGTTTDGNDGGHSWAPTDNACTECHSDPEAKISSLASVLDPAMITLAAQLENVVGWEYEYYVLRDINGDPILTSRGALIFADENNVELADDDDEFLVKVLDINGDPVINEVHAIIHDGHPNNGSQGKGAYFTILEAQAAWNYLFVQEDKSAGLHNPKYAKALIANSIEALPSLD